MNWSSFRPGGGGFRCLRPAGRLLGYRGLRGHRWDTAAGVLLGTALVGTGWGTLLVGVISSYLRVLIGPKVMTISLSVVDWLRTR